jgi:isocitrate lyase
MLSEFDYLSVAQDIIARSDAEELELLDAAIRERRAELGLEEPTPRECEASTKDPVSQVVERRAHEDGELVLERRAYVRKDGTRTWRGPYWYFHTREGSRQKTIYLGKTDQPEAKLSEKRA